MASALRLIQWLVVSGTLLVATPPLVKLFSKIDQKASLW
jgi:hypothetical protein